MPRISLKAVIISNIVHWISLAVGIVAAMIILYAAMTIELGTSDIAAVSHILETSTSTIITIIGVSLLVPLPAGYVAAKIAKDEKILHGALATLAWMIVVVLYDLFGGSSSDSDLHIPQWLDLLTSLAIPLPAMLGAFWQMRRSAPRNGAATPFGDNPSHLDCNTRRPPQPRVFGRARPQAGQPDPAPVGEAKPSRSRKVTHSSLVGVFSWLALRIILPKQTYSVVMLAVVGAVAFLIVFALAFKAFKKRRPNQATVAPLQSDLGNSTAPERVSVPSLRGANRRLIAGLALFIIAIAGLFWRGAADSSARRPEAFFDDFTQDGTLAKGWIVNEPNPSSSHSIGATGLVLKASGQNGGSDLWMGTNYRASTVLRPVPPSADWTIITHFIFTPEIDFQAAGLVLTMEPGHFSQASKFHRFELSYQNRQNGLGVASYTNGPIDPPFARYSSSEVYLKLTKAGAAYKYYYSVTGKSWTLVSTIIDASPYSYVGLDSIRQPWHGSPTLDSQPVFKSFCYLRAEEADDDAACSRTPIS